MALAMGADTERGRGLDERDCAESGVGLPSCEGILHTMAGSGQEPGAARIRSRHHDRKIVETEAPGKAGSELLGG